MTSVTFPSAVGGDGSTVSDDSSATTGLGNGGFRTRLIPAFTNVVNIAQNTVTQATNAATSATNAAASAATAASAPGTNATSTTSLTIGTGSQTLTIQTGKSLVVGMFVTIANTAAPTNLMFGNITAYNSGTGSLTVNVTVVQGSGTFAAWTVALVGAQGAKGASANLTTVNATITANATLASSYLYVPIQMTAIGQAVTLPAANSLGLGGPQFILDNTKGTYPAGIRDNTGTLVMSIAPGGEAYVSLKDNTTQGGIWSVDGTNLEPGLISIDSTLSGTYGAPTNDGVTGIFVAINNNQSIHFAPNAARTSIYAFIVDSTGYQVTVPVLMASGLAAGVYVRAAWAVTATTFIVFYSSGNNDTYAVILSVSGTTITVGSPTSVITNATLLNSDFGSGAPQIVQLSSTLYAISGYQTTSLLAAVAFSVSGTTITAGTVATLAVSSLYSGSVQVYALTSTTALVLYTTGAGAPYTSYGVVVSVSGTTCTFGTAVALSGTGSANSGGSPAGCLLSPTTALVATDGNGSVAGYVSVCTISGTTVSWGTPVAVETTGLNGRLSYTDQSANRYCPRLYKLSTTTAFLWYVDGISFSRSMVLTVSGSSVSAGTILYGAMSAGGGSGSPDFGFPLAFGPSEILAVKQRANSAAGYWLFAQPTKVSGTSVTTGYGKALHHFGQLAPQSVWCNRISNGDYVLAASTPSSPELVVMRSNGDAISLRGTISMPPMKPDASFNYQNGNVAPNRVVLIGSTDNGPLTSTLVNQLRILSVEIAA
jgi:hypothetical protein